MSEVFISRDSYFVVLQRPGEELQLITKKSEAELVSFLSDLKGAANGYVFKGQRLKITGGKWRHLIIPGKPAIPLFPTVSVEAARNDAVLGTEESEDKDEKLYDDLVEQLQAEATKDEGLPTPQQEETSLVEDEELDPELE